MDVSGSNCRLARRPRLDVPAPGRERDCDNVVDQLSGPACDDDRTRDGEAERNETVRLVAMAAARSAMTLIPGRKR